MNTSTQFVTTQRPTLPARSAPGGWQLFVLLAVSSLAALVTAVLGPSLPAMQAHFADVPNIDLLVPMVMGAPALSMALICIFAGELSDRWGRKRLMLIAALGYAVVGTMPLYLDSLAAILASRFALGAFEAVLMTVTTTMIGDYYSGLQRDRYMTMQTTATSITGIVISLIGGALAAYGWRMPYVAFGISLFFVPLIVMLLWEPVTRATMPAAQREVDTQSFRRWGLAWRCVLGVVGGLALLIVGAHYGYLFKSIGVESTQQVGLAYAINGLGMIVGSIVYGWAIASRLSVPVALAIGAALGGLSLASLPFANSFILMTAAGTGYGFAMGILLPTMLTWNMRELPLSLRGFGTGAFQSCFFLGVFFSPVLVVALERVIAVPRVEAIAIEGHFLLAASLCAFLVGLVRQRA